MQMGEGGRMLWANRVRELVPPNSDDYRHVLELFLEYADEDTLAAVVRELEAEQTVEGEGDAAKED